MNNKIICDVKSHPTYLYKQDDIRELMIHASYAANNAPVTIYTKGGKPEQNYYNGSFQAYMDDKLGLISTENINNISSYYPEINLEKRAGSVLITAGNKTYSAPVEVGALGILVSAAPYKSTYKPVATRYELDSDGVQNLLRSMLGMYNSEKVYKIASGDGNCTYDYLNQENLCNAAGMSLLRNGNAVCKYPRIKLFKLSNGFGLQLGGTMCLITEANPSYKTGAKVFIKQKDPNTERFYFDPVKIALSKGFNPTLKQFAYDITMDNGNKVFDVPESELSVYNPEEIEQEQTNVVMNHF